jgi:tryptophan synthase alpha chain
MTRPAVTTIAGVIDRCRAEGRAALVGYLPVGFPDLDTSAAALTAAAAAGVDALEVGIPYSDPVIDGPVVAAAADRALRGGTRVADAFTVARRVTTARPDTAVLFMTYWNLVEQYGVERFVTAARDSGVTGVITPDLLPDEAGEWLAASDAHDLERVFLVAPSSPEERLRLVARHSSGFVYAASTMGVTGVRDEVGPAARSLVARARAAGGQRVCVGLGVSTPQQAAEIAEYADGVIVGSALVRALDGGGPDAVAELVAALAAGVRSAARPVLA